jgi:LysM repeat protein
MTIRSLNLAQSILLSILLTLLLAIPARSQEQTQPAAPQPESPAKGQQASQPEEQPQSGEVLVPRQKTQTPEEPVAAAAADQKKEREENAVYTIKQGDTLWDISNAFLKDPFLWPFIWKANPSIADADLIYPGNKLVIPSLAPIERALQEQPAEQKEAEKEKPVVQAPPAARQRPTSAAGAAVEEAEQPAPSKLILPEEAPKPILDSYSMLNAGYVMPEEMSKDVIAGSKEGKTILGYDDIVYVAIHSREDAAPGDKFLIYEPLKKVKHPATGRVYGSLIKTFGILQLIEKGSKPGVFSARITLSFDAAGTGDLLAPYQEPTLVYPAPRPENAVQDITGYILEVLDGRTINAQTDIIYLDKGSADGVEPGDQFTIYTNATNASYPRNVLGEAQAFLVKQHTSTAVVRKSTNTIARGDRIDLKK